MPDEAKPKKTFVVCQACGTLFRVEVEKVAAHQACVKCSGTLVPLKGDVPHDQIATVLYLKGDEIPADPPPAESKPDTRKRKKDGGESR